VCVCVGVGACVRVCVCVRVRGCVCAYRHCLYGHTAALAQIFAVRAIDKFALDHGGRTPTLLELHRIMQHICQVYDYSERVYKCFYPGSLSVTYHFVRKILGGSQSELRARKPQAHQRADVIIKRRYFCSLFRRAYRRAWHQKWDEKNMAQEVRDAIRRRALQRGSTL
jgi:hypothetical protein